MHRNTEQYHKIQIEKHKYTESTDNAEIKNKHSDCERPETPETYIQTTHVHSV